MIIKGTLRCKGEVISCPDCAGQHPLRARARPAKDNFLGGVQANLRSRGLWDTLLWIAPGLKGWGIQGDLLSTGLQGILAWIGVLPCVMALIARAENALARLASLSLYDNAFFFFVVPEDFGDGGVGVGEQGGDVLRGDPGGGADAFFCLWGESR